MPAPPAVVLNCAGMGTRLGLGQTKALIELLGRPLIHWQLDLLAGVPDLRVVVGYNAQGVIDAVTSQRRDALFVLNHRYAETATGDSLLLGARHASGEIVSLDGDLLVAPSDMVRIIHHPGSVLGVSAATSEDPVFASVTTKDTRLEVTGFSRSAGSAWEWTGLVKLPAAMLLGKAPGSSGKHHVYQLVEPLLPMTALDVEVSEVDTPSDYERTVAWLSRHTADGKWKP